MFPRHAPQGRDSDTRLKLSTVRARLLVGFLSITLLPALGIDGGNMPETDRLRINVNVISRRQNVKNTCVEWLADHLDLVSTVAQWIYREWGYLHPGGGSLDQATKRVYQRAQRGRIPTAFIALDAGTPVGTACILEYDSAMDRAIEEARAADAALDHGDFKGPETHGDLTPWLCAVYVVPEHRRRGIASELVRHAMQMAKRTGAETLYLYSDTDAGEALYQSLGWQILERQDYSDLHATLMFAVLDEISDSAHSPGVG